jgi:hypothetical protein
MRRVVSRLAARFANRPGQLDILYVNNEQDRVIEMQSGFTRIFLGQVRRSRSDAIADHRIMANQPNGEYEPRFTKTAPSGAGPVRRKHQNKLTNSSARAKNDP